MMGGRDAKALAAAALARPKGREITYADSAAIYSQLKGDPWRMSWKDIGLTTDRQISEIIGHARDEHGQVIIPVTSSFDPSFGESKEDYERLKQVFCGRKMGWSEESFQRVWEDNLRKRRGR